MAISELDIKQLLKQAHDALTKVESSQAFKRHFEKDCDSTIEEGTLFRVVKLVEAVMDEMDVKYEEHY